MCYFTDSMCRGAVLILLPLSVLSACGNKPNNPVESPVTQVVANPVVVACLQSESKTTASGNHYTVLYKDSASVDFTLQRPDQKDPSIVLCIAGAFTDLNTGKVDGASSVDGKINSNKINARLGGGILLDGKNCDILPFKRKTDTLDASILKRLDLCKCSFFQQIQVVVNSKAEHFIDTKLFQRRAIVIFKDKRIAIAESKEALTLASFSADLVELGAQDALYTDMGDWDEGWYKAADGTVKVIGTSRAQTAKQSNWVYFKR
jgi:hypothetical protein